MKIEGNFSIESFYDDVYDSIDGQHAHDLFEQKIYKQTRIKSIDDIDFSTPKQKIIIKTSNKQQEFTGWIWGWSESPNNEPNKIIVLTKPRWMKAYEEFNDDFDEVEDEVVIQDHLDIQEGDRISIEIEWIEEV